MATKERQVEYYVIEKKFWENSDKPNVEEPFHEIIDILSEVVQFELIDKMYQLKKDKSAYLCFFKQETNLNSKIFTGLFKSGVKNYRPDLMDILTGAERSNPKGWNEADAELTHFCIKICQKEIVLLLEKNGNGITINQFINYVKNFLRQVAKRNNENVKYSIITSQIPKDNFFDELAKLKRTQIAEIYVDKSILGKGALEFANRTTTVKNDVVLTMKAQPNESITDTLMEIGKKIGRVDYGIRKIRIFGKDGDNHKVAFDSSFLTKKSIIEAELNPSTGVVITPNILTELTYLAEQIK